MSTSVYRSFCFKLLLSTYALHTQLAFASDADMPSSDTVEQQELFLSVVVNQASSSVYGHFI